MSKNKNKNFEAVMEIVFDHYENSWRYINEEFITLHFEIGEYLSKMISEGKYNDKDIEALSNELLIKYPRIKELNSKEGLYKLIKFYETYKKEKTLITLAKQTTWANNLIILDLDVTMDEREYYLMMCSSHNLDQRQLEELIKGNNYQKHLSDLEKMKKRKI